MNSGADVNFQNSDGQTALHIAVYHANEDIVQLLLNSGADVNIQDKYGFTALHYAVFTRNEEIVQLLLNSAAANTSLKDDQGKTALDHAKDLDENIADLIQSHNK